MNRRREVIKAISSVLKLNYRKRLLSMEVHPLRVVLFYAVSFLKDKQEKWMPRVITFYDDPDIVMIQEFLGDLRPHPVSADVILAMAENHSVTSPPDGSTA